MPLKTLFLLMDDPLGVAAIQVLRLKTEGYQEINCDTSISLLVQACSLNHTLIIWFNQYN
jgi:hypothetical protein